MKRRKKADDVHSCRINQHLAVSEKKKQPGSYLFLENRHQTKSTDLKNRQESTGETRKGTTTFTTKEPQQCQRGEFPQTKTPKFDPIIEIYNGNPCGQAISMAVCALGGYVFDFIPETKGLTTLSRHFINAGMIYA